MCAIVGMVAGDVDFNGCNTLTGQRMRARIQTDRNMDGVIDEQDGEVARDVNFGVLTTRFAFSCGNLFPFMMQENGAAVIGEPTGGGSCIVQMMTLSDGHAFLMSSDQWRILNRNGEGVEAGAVPDLPSSGSRRPMRKTCISRVWSRATILRIMTTRCRIG